MVRHTPKHQNPKVDEDYFCNQDRHDKPVFIGGRNQGGYGIGCLISGLGRMALQWLKNGAMRRIIGLTNYRPGLNVFFFSA